MLMNSTTSGGQTIVCRDDDDDDYYHDHQVLSAYDLSAVVKIESNSQSRSYPICLPACPVRKPNGVVRKNRELSNQSAVCWSAKKRETFKYITTTVVSEEEEDKNSHAGKQKSRLAVMIEYHGNILPISELPCGIKLN